MIFLTVTFNLLFVIYLQTMLHHIRPCQAIDGRTPTQAVGIDLEIGRNRWIVNKYNKAQSTKKTTMFDEFSKS